MKIQNVTDNEVVLDLMEHAMSFISQMMQREHQDLDIYKDIPIQRITRSDKESIIV
jgi:hypothetical protein